MARNANGLEIKFQVSTSIFQLFIAIYAKKRYLNYHLSPLCVQAVISVVLRLENENGDFNSL